MSQTSKHIEKRFSYDKKGKQIDIFYRAWILANAQTNRDQSGSTGKDTIKEYTEYAQAFCLTDYPNASTAEKESLVQEWHSFAKEYLLSCKNSRSYGTALFGILPLSADTIKQKILAECTRITKDYPSKLGLEELFKPLYEIMMEETGNVL